MPLESLQKDCLNAAPDFQNIQNSTSDMHTKKENNQNLEKANLPMNLWNTITSSENSIYF